VPRPERRARVAHRQGHEREYLLRRAGDEREHDHREGERCFPRRLAASNDQQAEDEDADHDRGDAVEDVEREPHRSGRLLPRELARVERDEDAHRNGHRRRESHDYGGADDRVGNSTRLEAEARRVRRLREEVEVDRADSP
jgi:hypothetical protein